jgi:membrane-associated protease RseP (regulator of RpoE activity)
MTAYLVGVLVFVVGLAFSVAVHELGHLIPAKRFGIRCTQYMIGFGPTLWSRRFGDTEYGVRAIPLGGFVRILGMLPPKPGTGPVTGTDPAHAPASAGTSGTGPETGPTGTEPAGGARSGAAEPSSPRRGRWTTMIEQAREDALREVGPEDANRLFYQRTVGQRLIIMLGGPLTNLLLATVLIGITMTVFGIPTATTRVATVSQCVLPVDAPADATCTDDTPLAPAAEAGVLPGDQIVAFAGQPVDTWAEVREAIRANRGTAATLTVLRDGQRLDLTVTPLVSQRKALDADGNPVTQNGVPVLVSVGFLGVSPEEERAVQPLSAVPPVIGDGITQIAGVVLRIPEKMVGVAKAAFGSAERDPNSPVSVVGVGRFAGEIGRAQGTESAPITRSDRIAGWLSLIASLNLALFVFNLIPLLPLDGGHVAGALWEGVRRGFARLRSRPDPGPVDVARALPLAYGVASVLIAMSVLLIYADIVHPLSLDG